MSVHRTGEKCPRCSGEIIIPASTEPAYKGECDRCGRYWPVDLSALVDSFQSTQAAVDARCREYREALEVLRFAAGRVLDRIDVKTHRRERADWHEAPDEYEVLAALLRPLAPTSGAPADKETRSHD